MNPQRILNLVGEAAYLPVAATDAGGLSFEVELTPGIYRVSVLFDAARFNWERLYIPMDRFGNTGQRTGPWDFDFEGARPLTPAWWVAVDGQRIGLVCSPRPSPGELRRRRLRLNFCFEVRRAGRTRVEMSPYALHDLTWLSFQIAPAVEQAPADVSLPTPVSDASLAGHQARRQVWRRWKDTIDAPASRYAALVPRAIEAAKTPFARASEALQMLAFAHLAYGDDEARRLLVDGVRRFVEMPHWGNPRPDGYGHDADMSAAAIIDPLSFVYHWAADALEAAGLREPLRDKLRLQMQRFYDLLLLWEDYWGGSLLQDHGHRSVGRFGAAAANMLGTLDEAPHWFAFAVHRMQRVLDALPNDGGMPFTSYIKVQLYVDDMATWRDALRHATGRDIFERPLFAQVIDFVVNRLDETTMDVMCAISRGDRKDFDGGWGFFNAIAECVGDRRAARLTELLVERHLRGGPVPLRPVTTLLAAIGHESGVEPAPLAPEPFDVRLDTGMINYRPTGRGVNVSMRCVAPPAISSHYRTFCPCDRAVEAPLEGHFTVSVAGRTLLLTAEGGYRQHSRLGCVLLIDGAGPFGGDDEYPMGSFDTTFRGACIEAARHDPADGTAYVRMRLDPAYPREAQLVRYYREFLLRPDGMLCRDRVVSTAEHEYGWYFHTYASRSIDPGDDNAVRITDGDASLVLQARALESPVAVDRGVTEVVWSYSNENHDETFAHLHYRTTKPCRVLTAEFEVTWQ